MKTIPYKLFPFLQKAIPFKALISLTGQHFICPFYHAVADDDVIHIKHLYRIKKISDFEKDLDFLIRHFKPVDYALLLEHLKNGNKLPGNSFLLSFDDGLREFHDVIAPILLRKGVPAICFLNSGFIDNKDLFFRYKASILIETILKHKSLITAVKDWLIEKEVSTNGDITHILTIDYHHRSLLDDLSVLLGVSFDDYLAQHQPYLTTSQVLDLKQKGFHFGAHSVDHPLFSSLTMEQQIIQLTTSLNKICDGFELDNRLFSFPFTDHGVSKAFFNKMFDPEKPLADLTFGCSGLKKDILPFHLQRIPMEIQGLSAKEILSSEYLYYCCKGLIGKNTTKRN
jgi:peptidoglycan/xylan/chitin deacetylase (PgdA/CDA1 family)